MQLEIPSLPTLDQIWITPDNVQYRWTGATWELVDPYSTPVSRVPTCTTAPLPPAAPFPADFWYNTTSGFLFIYYDDGNTLQWVVCNPGRGPSLPSPIGPPSSVFIDDYPPMNPVSGALWWSNDLGILFIYYDDGNSAQWVATGGGSGSGSSVYVGDTPPAGVLPKTLWWNSALGALYIYYDDGNTVQWVPATPLSTTGLDANTFNVRVFGAKGDGVTDDTAAFQTAITAAGQFAVPLYGSVANTVTSWVVVPPGTYRISSVTFPAYVGIRGGTVTGRMTRETIIKHFDPSVSCFILPGRNSVRGLYFDVNNTNVDSPTVTPPTIASTVSAAANEVSDCIFQFAYIAIGAPAAATASAWTVNNVAGFFHHRLVYLKNTTDISYLSNLHGGPVESTVWSTSSYAHANRVLVEMDNADGLVGENWFIWGGRGVFKHSGLQNLITSLQNITGENITHGIEIASGSTNPHQISIDGGYIFDFERVTVDGFALKNAADVNLHVSNFMFFGGSGGIPGLAQIESTGQTSFTGCTFEGNVAGVTNAAIRKNSANSRVSVDGSHFTSCQAYFSFAPGCDKFLTISPSCSIAQNMGTLFNMMPTGLVDITKPVLYDLAGSGSGTITRYTPSSSHVLFSSGSFLVHEQAANATGGGGSFEATASNAAAADSIGARARFKCYNTVGTVGTESARAHIQAYNAGAYGPPFVVFEAGGIGYQSGLGAGGSVTQTVDKTTTVALNKTCGNIVTMATNLAANTAVSFTFTNTTINAVDILHIKHGSGGTMGAYRVEAVEAAGSAVVTITNITAGALAQALTLKFYVFKPTLS